MAELLAISIAIMLLLSILVSNFIPLVAEYENRTNYNNVTADYAAFYVRKVYNTSLGTTTVENNLKASLNTNGYATVYKSKDVSATDSVTDPTLTSSTNLKGKLTNIINNYGIEEIIITTYKTGTVKTKYNRSKGSLYDFIKYLPTYNQSSYGSGKPNTIEPYRIILKTKDFGYATTQILPDPPTPTTCFNLSYGTVNGATGFTITNYNPNLDECKDNSKNVIISSTPFKYGSNTGQIVAIGNSAFKDKNLDSIDMQSNVKTIGTSAFENNNIKSFNFQSNAPGVTKVENNAFKGNALTKVIIPDNVTFGSSVFANNYSLKKITFDFNNYSKNTTIPEKMFSLDYKNDTNIENKRSNIDLYIPSNVTTIGESAFENLKIHKIDFGGSVLLEKEEGSEEYIKNNEPSKLTQIYASAFNLNKDWFIDDSYDGHYLEITVPRSVTTIGNSAFQNLKIGDLTFEDVQANSAQGIEAAPSQLNSIGNNAFSIEKDVNVDNIENKGDFYDENDNVYTRNLKIPTSVKNIGNNAFSKQQFKNIVIDDIDTNGNITKAGELQSIGSGALSGNAMETFTFPKTITIIGTSVFGDSTIGSQQNQIVVRDSNILKGEDKENLWCNALYGVLTSNGCTYEAEKVMSEVEEEIPEGDPDYVPVEPGSSENPNTRIVEKEIETGTYICSYNGAKRYITPVDEGGTNE